MSFLPRDPRDAPPGNRTIWVSVWGMEWGIILTVGSLAMGFVALLGYNKTGAEIAAVIGAPMAILSAFMGWGMRVYLQKSRSRGLKPGGPEQEDGP